MRLDVSPARLERVSPPRSRLGVDLRLSLVGGPPAVPWRFAAAEPADLRPLADVIAAATAVDGRPGAFLLGGEEPLRRPDLWDLIQRLAQLRPSGLGLCTFGAGLTPVVVRRLRAAGVQRANIPVHSARQDAHDWLAGRSGALKTALRGIRACVEAGLPVTADIMLTRPTAAVLAETVELVARLGVRGVCVRRLTAPDTDAAGFVALSPRLGLLEAHLERAAAVALERRVRMRLRDLPLCVAPRLRSLLARPASEGWVMPDGALQPRIAAGIGCPGCPEQPACAGAPSDYVARFGWEEFADAQYAAERLGETSVQQRTAASPAEVVLHWRGPRRVRCEACGDDSAAPSAPEPTRIVRTRLVQAARYRPAVLRLVGADLLAHPRAAALIYDAVRLFRHVEIAGEASATVDWSDLDLRRMKELRRLDVALYGPDAASHDAHCGIPGAFAAMMRGVERLRADTPVPIGAYAIIHDAKAVPAFAAAWAADRLPGEPRFRLATRGADLDDLVQSALDLPDGPARSALLAVLPRCLCMAAGLAIAEDRTDVTAAARRETIRSNRPVPYKPLGSDPVGAFEPCAPETGPCAAEGCIGTAVGWHRTLRTKRWPVTR